MSEPSGFFPFDSPAARMTTTTYRRFLDSGCYAAFARNDKVWMVPARLKRTRCLRCDDFCHATSHSERPAGAKNPENAGCNAYARTVWILPIRLACGSLRAGSLALRLRMTRVLTRAGVLICHPDRSWPLALGGTRARATPGRRAARRPPTAWSGDGVDRTPRAQDSPRRRG